MKIPMGQAKLRIRPDASTGRLDHVVHAHGASWTVQARVVTNGDGSEFMMTFFQPPTFGDDFFKLQINLVDSELAKLKQIMES